MMPKIINSCLNILAFIPRNLGRRTIVEAQSLNWSGNYHIPFNIFKQRTMVIGSGKEIGSFQPNVFQNYPASTTLPVLLELLTE